MRKLVITLLQSMPMLMDVGVLLSFAFFIFGIVGVQLFSGSVSKRCMVPIGLEETYDDAWPMAMHLGEPIENTTTPQSWWLLEDEYQEICSAVAVRFALPYLLHSPPSLSLRSSERMRCLLFHQTILQPKKQLKHDVIMNTSKALISSGSTANILPSISFTSPSGVAWNDGSVRFHLEETHNTTEPGVARQHTRYA
jgi:hypothetical protein